MANLSFLDLMLAEALAAGLARERAQAEKPPPGNFFVLPSDLRAWRQIKEASEKENMVVCLEITRQSNENCARVQRIVMDLAREFENIPFLRVFIEPFSTFDELRKEVGGVQYTPTILILFFDAGDSISRAKFEGFQEIMGAMSTGAVKGTIKELLRRRAKLKMLEGLIAQHMRNQMSERERRVREDYEKAFLKKMEEEEQKKEEQKKEEEKRREAERKRKEAEEELSRKRIEAEKEEERLKKERPGHLKELLAMNLDEASSGQMKKMMNNLGISSSGCVEKQDLRKKLVESVPELRIKVGSKSQSNTIQPTSSYKKLETNGESEMDQLRKELSEKKSQLEQTDKQLKALRKENKDLKGDSMVLKNLEEQLLVTRILHTTSLDNYKECGVLHEPTDRKMVDSLVLRVKCTKPWFPLKDKYFAMKVVANYFKSQSHSQTRRKFQKEYETLQGLPLHENITNIWAFFVDRSDPTVMGALNKLTGESVQSMSLFYLMDEFPTNMADHLEALMNSGGPSPSTVIDWIRDLLKGLIFLESNKIVHRDLKLESLFKKDNGTLVIGDFEKSLVMDDDCSDFTVRHSSSGFDIGGNDAHLAPEILNSRPGGGRYLDYSKQPVWAAGVLAYELVGHKNPFQHSGIDQRSYTLNDIPPLEKTHCHQQYNCRFLPAGLTNLVRSMLDPGKDRRPTLQWCLHMMDSL